MSEADALLIELKKQVESIQEGVASLLDGPFKRDTIILLIQKASPRNVRKEIIEDVLCGMEHLAEKHLKPKADK